ncbi:MAG TPA: YbhB/YbcL family Raf kinase inhibitor-like protein [Acidimicrobiia bacterium]|nr:YbhB/YbcL family Raf kinase inhibitor-like protein [Acidimicrobiia bacterium]
MELTSNSISPGKPIPSEFAFAEPDPESHIRFAGNRNPHLRWSGAPAATRSFAIVAVDPDVPSVGTDVNQEGRTVPADLPRVNFYHWLLVDLPPSTSEIGAGSHSQGVTARGKPGPGAPGGGRHGLNSYTGWFAGDAEMEGDYFGYDGPCPPWNDERLHHYTFTVYALDTERASVDGSFEAAELLEAIEGHILDQASLMGTYALNPGVLAE